MSGETRVLQFSEGVSVGTPVTTNVTALGVQTFVDDTAYTTAKGAPGAEGDMYYNTTTDTIRFFKDSAFIDVLDESILILTLNSGGDQATADGSSGIEISMSDATNVRMIYDSTLTSRFKIGDSGSESEIVVVGGSQTISGLKDFSGVLTVSNATASTDASTGAIVVTGGVGIGGDVNITGDLTVDGTTNTLNDLVVTDATITVNSGGTEATADSADAGIIVEMSDATDAQIGFDSTATSKFKLGEVGSLVEIADISSSQVITNKDIDGGTASDTSRITLPQNTTSNLDGLTRKEGTLVYDSDLKTIKIDDGTNLNEISGGGSGAKNFIENGTYDVNADGTTTYSDAAGARPVDGNGGSPTVTFARTTSTPLSGDGSGLFSKDAADRQGEGFSIDFTSDLAEKYSVQRIIFDYETSANYVDGDMVIEIYDITNSQLIQPSLTEIAAIAEGGKFISEFQTTDSTSYRLIAHVATTNANAYTVEIDNVSVGPREIARGPIATAWESVDITVRGSTTNPTLNPSRVLKSAARRNGSNLELTYFYRASGTGGAAGSGNYEFVLPYGLQIDSSAIEITNSGGISTVGSATVYDGTSASNQAGSVTIQGADALYITVGDQVTNTLLIGSGFIPVTNNNVFYSFMASVPIQGWSSSSTISSDFGGRSIEVEADGNAGTSLSAGVTEIDFIASRDTTSSWDGTGFTAPESKTFSFNGAVRFNASVNLNLGVYVDGSGIRDIQVAAAAQTYQFAFEKYLVKGQRLAFRSGSSATLQNAANVHYLNISAVQTPQSLAGGEKIIAVYNANAGQSVINGNVIDFEELVIDTHNAVTTGASWRFTAPRSTSYRISPQIVTNNVVATINTFFGFDGRLNGSTIVIRDFYYSQDSTANVQRKAATTKVVPMLKGEYIDFVFSENLGTISLAAGTQCYISIEGV